MLRHPDWSQIPELKQSSCLNLPSARTTACTIVPVSHFSSFNNVLFFHRIVFRSFPRSSSRTQSSSVTSRFVLLHVCVYMYITGGVIIKQCIGLDIALYHSVSADEVGRRESRHSVTLPPPCHLWLSSGPMDVTSICHSLPSLQFCLSFCC